MWQDKSQAVSNTGAECEAKRGLLSSAYVSQLVLFPCFLLFLLLLSCSTCWGINKTLTITISAFESYQYPVRSAVPARILKEYNMEL